MYENKLANDSVKALKLVNVYKLIAAVIISLFLINDLSDLRSAFRRTDLRKIEFFEHTYVYAHARKSFKYIFY